MRSLRSLLAVALLVGFFVFAVALIIGLGVVCYLAFEGGVVLPGLAIPAGLTAVAVRASLAPGGSIMMLATAV